MPPTIDDVIAEGTKMEKAIESFWEGDETGLVDLSKEEGEHVVALVLAQVCKRVKELELKVSQ